MHQEKQLGLALRSGSFLCIMAFGASAAVAQQPMSMERLERAFWVCDYTATTRGVFATHIEHCTAVTEGLKNEKFGGDFGALVVWWRQNKPTEHGRLKAADDGR